NRAEAATLLWRVLGLGDPTEVSADPFGDVDMTEWYAPYIAGLKDLALVEGNPDGTYQPSEEINRAEFLQLAMNVYEYLNGDLLDPEEMTDAYADLDTTEWYASIVTLATDHGFVSGSTCDEGTCFNAGDSITRAEATVILYRMFAD
ncbi:MAG: S-layer homology domain-containing protein, partial [Candidatus Gracilibacteria bacterium]